MCVKHYNTSTIIILIYSKPLVDTKLPGFGRSMLDEVRKVTDKPVTLILNTHTHADHVSGNVEFPASIDIVAQENTKANMEKMPIFKEHNGVGMAKRTFKDKMTIGSGANQIDLYYFGPGHTNGDAWVVFPSLRVVHAGDIFSGKSVPLIDTSNGGSLLHISDSLKKAHDGIKNVDIVINVPPNDVAKLKADQRIKVIEGQENRTVFLGFDQSKDELQFSSVKGRNPLKDLRVRQAIAHAIDVEAIIRRVLRGQGIASGSMWTHYVNGWDRSIEQARLPLGMQFQRRAFSSPDLRITFRRFLRAERQNEQVEYEPPDGARNFDHARVGEEFAQIGAHG